MKVKSIFLTAFISAGTVFPAVASSGGQITFEGQVVDTPCSIDAGDLDQNVDFGIVAKSTLNKGGQTPAKSFKITLLGCEFTTAASASTTFNGQPGHGDTFGVSGQAKNIGIVLASNGKRIAPGTSVIQDLMPGDNSLNFQAMVEADPNPLKPVVVGDFTSVANFTISYK